MKRKLTYKLPFGYICTCYSVNMLILFAVMNMIKSNIDFVSIQILL